MLVGPDTSSEIRANEICSAALRESIVPAIVIPTLTYPVDEVAEWDPIIQVAQEVEAGLVRSV